MSTTAAMTAIASTQAALAAAEADRAHVERCKMTMPNFDAKTATVVEMRDYTDCVNAVYPSEFGPDVVIALKILFAVALVGGVWQVITAIRKSESFFDTLMFGLLGFIVTPIVFTLVVAICYGFVWFIS